jgi:hypothetical protein
MTEAVRELVAAADVIRTRLATLPINWEVQWAREEADLMLTAEARLTAAVAAVKAEEKPQTHRPAALPHYTDRDEIAENDGLYGVE